MTSGPKKQYKLIFFIYFLLDPCPSEGPIKSLLSVSPSVSSTFFLGMGQSFFSIFLHNGR